MSNPIYENCILYNTVSVQPDELNQNIEAIIIKKLRKKVEGKCLQEGYIKPGTVKLISRSAGVLNPAHFNGTAKYNVRYNADVCNPVQNQIIECVVDTVGKPGIRAYVEDATTSPLYIMLSKSHHLNNKYFTTLKENDHIKVKVINSEFNYYEEQIRVLAVLENTKPLDVHNLSEESQSRSKMSSNKLKNKISSKLTLKEQSDEDKSETEDNDEDSSIQSLSKSNKSKLIKSKNTKLMQKAKPNKIDDDSIELDKSDDSDSSEESEESDSSEEKEEDNSVDEK